mmetsp:Transcript_42689/g.105168  ORF Transcript_42689/g.105168 Transcript_42689/m.105168 type:complete len:248 (-) Transcript_42689:412-1155(-)
MWSRRRRTRCRAGGPCPCPRTDPRDTATRTRPKSWPARSRASKRACCSGSSCSPRSPPPSTRRTPWSRLRTDGSRCWRRCPQDSLMRQGSGRGTRGDWARSSRSSCMQSSHSQCSCCTSCGTARTAQTRSQRDRWQRWPRSCLQGRLSPPPLVCVEMGGRRLMCTPCTCWPQCYRMRRKNQRTAGRHPHRARTHRLGTRPRTQAPYAQSPRGTCYTRAPPARCKLRMTGRRPGTCERLLRAGPEQRP